MPIGFKKSLFGFNCDDVMGYIESTHRSFGMKEQALNDKIACLDKALKKANEELQQITAAKENVERELKSYTDKYDEIDRLSQNIGKLYLVAQANSKAVMKNAEENRELCRTEVEKNLGSIDSAHEQLEELKKKIIKTSEDFSAQVEQLITSLSDTRAMIVKNEDQSQEKTNNFNSLYASITK